MNIRPGKPHSAARIEMRVTPITTSQCRRHRSPSHAATVTRPATDLRTGVHRHRQAGARLADDAPNVATSLAVLARIAACDAACCFALGRRARGQDHRKAIPPPNPRHPWRRQRRHRHPLWYGGGSGRLSPTSGTTGWSRQAGFAAQYSRVRPPGEPRHWVAAVDRTEATEVYTPFASTAEDAWPSRRGANQRSNPVLGPSTSQDAVPAPRGTADNRISRSADQLIRSADGSATGMRLHRAGARPRWPAVRSHCG
jgi:hypothetical protein